MNEIDELEKMYRMPETRVRIKKKKRDIDWVPKIFGGLAFLWTAAVMLLLAAVVSLGLWQLFVYLYWTTFNR